MKLIKKLDMRKTDTASRSFRFALFLCPTCKDEIDTELQNGKRAKQCKSCSSSTHRMSDSKAYSIWQGIITRTTNDKSNCYDFYKDKVPPKKWFTFKGFWEDMQDGYMDGLTIDRIDNNKPYSKKNCRWTNSSIQAQNTRLLRKTNSSGYRGVAEHTKGRWQAYITENRKTHYLGLFDYPWTAAMAYDSFVITNKTEHTRNFKEIS